MRSFMVLLVLLQVFLLFFLILSCFCDDYKEIELQLTSEQSTSPSTPPSPYAFGYAAGRYPGHIDRTHFELSDGTGTVQGQYSYIDPFKRIRTVQYIADKNGFYPKLNYYPPSVPKDTKTVALAKEQHLRLYDKIAKNRQNNVVIVPTDSVIVSKAKDKHYQLYQKISAEHAELAAQLEAEQLKNKGTEHPIY